MNSKIRDIDIVDEPHFQGAEVYNEKVSETEESIGEAESALSRLRSEVPSSRNNSSQE